jgi:hypothetical protein
LIQQVKRDRRTQVCCEVSAANSQALFGKPTRLIWLSCGYPTKGAAQISVGETTSFVSLEGIAGIGWLGFLSSPHSQLPHWQTVASGLQQHLFRDVGFDEQQLRSI